jgi:D-alanyl-D-alanine endopeptidase (penicillin-binding protein 7)
MMHLLRLLGSLVLSMGLLSFGPRLEAQYRIGKEKVNALQLRVKNQDNAKKKGSQPASKKSATSGGFVAKPMRKDVKRGGPSMLNKKKTLAAAAAGGAAAGAAASSASAAASAKEAAKASVVAADQAAGRPSNGQKLGLHGTDDPLDLRSSVAYVMDSDSGKVVFEKNAEIVLPIASISKLMTSMVVIDAQQDLHQVLEITKEDIDSEKGTHSRLRVGTRLSRAELLHLALMSSENRAANALGRHYPGGLQAFVSAMNAKSRLLGMNDTRFVEPTGLSSRNVSTARDLAKMVQAAGDYPLIRQYSTSPGLHVDAGRSTLAYRNTNRLTHNPKWDIELQKTGYISEAGNCLVMQVRIEGKAMVMVLLDAKQKLARFADAQRLRHWIELKYS